LQAGPVPTIEGYSQNEPFDRVLRVPLRTPEMTPAEEAAVTGAVTAVSIVAGIGLTGRRDDPPGA
jgi:hypothetical protein